MGMVVRTNTMSANAYRQLGANNTQLSKSLEKLSSGFRINRAGDDSSGLAISEKMKAQIAGLDQASANSQDGISLVQTAEGALTEVHSMLNRMVTLAEKSANGTIDNTVDRVAIKTEVDALNEEITRISSSTNFNGIKLLDGSLDVASTVSATYGTTAVDFSTSAKTAGLGTTHTVQLTTTNVNDAGTIGVTLTNAGVLTITLGSKAASTYTASQITDAVRKQAAALVANTSVAADKAIYQNFTSFTMKSNNLSVATDAATDTTAVALTDVTGANGGLKLQVGDTADSFNQVTVNVANMSAAGLKTDTVDVSSQDAAKSAIDIIKTAINKVSTNRGGLGALQNRLEHAISNLDTTSENMSSANSAIRDTDMAKEMMNYTKMNILSQAAQSMLAQANQQPQNILQLLK